MNKIDSSCLHLYLHTWQDWAHLEAAAVSIFALPLHCRLPTHSEQHSTSFLSQPLLFRPVRLSKNERRHNRLCGLIKKHESRPGCTGRTEKMENGSERISIKIILKMSKLLRNKLGSEKVWFLKTEQNVITSVLRLIQLYLQFQQQIYLFSIKTAATST